MYLFVDEERLQDSQLYIIISFLSSDEHPHVDALMLEGWGLLLVREKLKARLWDDLKIKDDS